MGIYENLKQLARQPRRRAGVLFTDTGPAGVEIRVHAWRGADTPAHAIVSPANVATYYLDRSDQRANMAFGELGLGAVANSRSKAQLARLVYWRDGRAYVYHRGMQVDLTSGLVVGTAPALDNVVVDPKERLALLRLISSKVPAVLSYLRVSGVGLTDIRKGGWHDPGAFIEAVRENKTSKIAAIPVTRLRSHRRNSPKDPLHACWPDVLKRYINQNRAELYHAAGVVKRKEDA